MRDLFDNVLKTNSQKKKMYLKENFKMVINYFLK